MHTCSDHAKCCHEHSQPTLCTPFPSSPITSHCTFQHSIFQSWYHSFTNFRNNLLATLAKLIHWHLSIFSLKLYLLYWPLKPWQWLGHCLMEASSSLISNAFYFPVSVSSALDSLSDFNSVQKGTFFILCLLYNSLDKEILDSHVFSSVTVMCQNIL